MSLKWRKFKCPLCGHERVTCRNKKQMCNHNQDEEGEPASLVEMLFIQDVECPEDEPST